jgi:hypothetical protein
MRLITCPRYQTTVSVAPREALTGSSTTCAQVSGGLAISAPKLKWRSYPLGILSTTTAGHIIIWSFREKSTEVVYPGPQKFA